MLSVQLLYNIQLLYRRSIYFSELVIFAFQPGAMINLHWLELPMARTILHGPKGVRAIEVRLYGDKQKEHQAPNTSSQHSTLIYIGPSSARQGS